MRREMEGGKDKESDWDRGKQRRVHGVMEGLKNVRLLQKADMVA